MHGCVVMAYDLATSVCRCTAITD